MDLHLRLIIRLGGGDFQILRLRMEPEGCNQAGQSHWRDYQSITNGIYQPMSALLSDCVFSNNNGTITIMIKDLKPEGIA